MPDDRDRERLERRKKAREQRRRQLRRRIAAGVAVLAACIAVVAVVSRIGRNGGFSASSTGTTSVSSSGNEVSAEDVLHLSFPQLIVDEVSSSSGGSSGAASQNTSGTASENTSGTASQDEESDDEAVDYSGLTVSEFNQILAELYKNDYVLVDFYSLTHLTQGTGYTTETLDLPEGKKPLVISVTGVSYGGTGETDSDSDTAESSIGKKASGIEVDSSGMIVNDVTDENGTAVTGAYDVMTCVDTFIGNHPDFSNDGARGIIAVTGSEGILGYDPSDSAGKAEMEKVISALKEEGWIFASGTYSGISYGSEYSIVKEDAEKWQSEVGPYLKDTDILILPDRADIGSWSPYSSDNEKFSLLSGEGFVYFCVDNSQSLTWLETGTDYVRQGMHGINTKSEFDALMDGGIEEYSALVEKKVQQEAENIASENDANLEENGTDSEDASENSTGSGTDSQDQDIENVDSEV